MTHAAQAPRELTKILLDAETLQRRIGELAVTINRDYAGRELILICVLKGSALFTVDLMKHLDLRVAVDFISISSYGEATKSTGVVKMVKDMEEDIKGKHVLVVEDIVDTGLTLDYLRRVLLMREPASLKICSLLSKPARRKVDLPIDYLGFTIDDHFVVGYGLDYLSFYRNLPYIGILDPALLDE
ncbi:MAG: hypoxanthine phosphoribosyltransferase [Vulcanimicrobiota bacterium]